MTKKKQAEATAASFEASGHARLPVSRTREQLRAQVHPSCACATSTAVLLQPRPQSCRIWKKPMSSFECWAEASLAPRGW